jgi:hypothetical protein
MRFSRASIVIIIIILFVSISISRSAQAAPLPLSANAIDRQLAAAWRAKQLTPGPLVDDAGFLRRLTVDLTGTIPTAEAVRVFLADKHADKRLRAIDALLSTPEYALHWATYWDRLLMGRTTQGNIVDRVAFGRWLYERFANNRPWDEIVFQLLSASGQNTLGGVKKNALGPVQEPEPDPTGQVHAAVNWLLRYNQNPIDLTGKVSRLFLGVQVQCAQCHDHPSEKWKQKDFRSLAACFSRTAMKPLEERAKGLVRRVELVDQARPAFGGPNNADLKLIAMAPPRALDGSDFSTTENRRLAFAHWVTRPDNPYFARALVNRYWAHFVGRGFYEPIDDYRRSNPVVLPSLLEAITADFVANKYDLKHLIRIICATRAYQLAVVPGAPGELDEQLFVHHRMRLFNSEELYNALAMATNLENALQKAGLPNIEQLKLQIQNAFDFLFSVDEEGPPPAEFAGSIQQALLFLNGKLINRASAAVPGMTLAGILDFPTDDAQKIEALYLRTLSRRPTAAETRRWLEFINAPRDIVVEDKAKQRELAKLARTGKGGKKSPLNVLDRAARRLNPDDPTTTQQAYEDLFWALLNSSELIFQH